MIIHKTKKDAIEAIEKYAAIMREASKKTGVDFLAEAWDDSGMEYYCEAFYKNGVNTEILKIHFQELDL